MDILQINTKDIGGGAERIAWNLFHEYAYLGHQSWLAVGQKLSQETRVLPISHSPHLWAALGMYAQSHIQNISWRAGQVAARLAEPRRTWDRWRGTEDFHFAGTRTLLNLLPHRPSLLHAHNLHGGYFDLRQLPALSQQIPFFLTLHDSWMFTGHCSHSFDCERWLEGCGQCPDLTIYPAIARDNTAHNWQRKRDIYQHSQLYVATPSHWLMQRVEKSMLMPAIQEARVIHNGVNLNVFHPAERNAVRTQLGLPLETPLLLFTGSRPSQNIFKNYALLREALAHVTQPLILLVLGEAAPAEKLNEFVEIRFIPFTREPEDVARYYQAVDLYVHPARIDTFPNVIIEALACGTPVIATPVGGIPEQIHDLTTVPADQATGMLVKNAGEMTQAIEYLLTHATLRLQLGDNAVRDVQHRFNQADQVQHYLRWYQEILDKRG